MLENHTTTFTEVKTWCTLKPDLYFTQSMNSFCIYWILIKQNDADFDMEAMLNEFKLSGYVTWVLKALCTFGTPYDKVKGWVLNATNLHMPLRRWSLSLCFAFLFFYSFGPATFCPMCISFYCSLIILLFCPQDSVFRRIIPLNWCKCSTHLIH